MLSRARFSARKFSSIAARLPGLTQTMGGSSSKEAASLENFISAEQNILHSGLNWWRSVQRAALEVGESPTAVSFKVFDVNISPEPDAHPVLHAEQEKFGKPLHIHTALFTDSESELEAELEDNEVPIVMLHGYGSGLGIYSASLGPLASTLRRKIYAVDGLGCGLSARPKWTLGHGTSSDLDDVEAYSADALDLWRQQIGAEKIILCGHSIGGYLSVAYAERYPERVEKLLLLSPAGVVGPPPEDPTRRPSALFRFARYLWAKGISPLAASKYVFGRFFIDKYVERRFQDQEWLDKPATADYLNGVWTHGEPSAGAYHHTTILLPGAYARRPLEDRIAQLKVPAVAAMYGTSDWMNPNHFARVHQRHSDMLQAKSQKAAAGDASDSNGAAPTEEAEQNEDDVLLRDLQLMLIDEAGHNLQLDNPLAFTAAMQAYLLREENCHGRTFAADHAVCT
eukprot:INCI4434.1.p1 GENE.INCI4434.1~~INCI4434.1.p1  ORF type:complete len:455 (+),score=84.45 INCI4434.1:168-1532(+)